MQIEQVVDDTGAAAFHALECSTTPIDHPGLVGEPLDDLLGMLPNPLPSYRVEFYLGRAGDEVVATGFFGLPLIDNTHMCQINVTVALDARRRGFGTEMAEFLLEKGRGAGRRNVNATASAPLDGTSPGNEFAAKLGAADALGSIRRELRLADVDRGELEGRLAELRDGSCAPYDLVTWQGRCPDDLVEGAAAILPLVMSDSPRGDLEMDDEVWDAARYREFETMFAARKRHQLVAAAVERSTGTVAALTDLNVPLSEHRVVAQMGTVVEPTHRGHRLGIAVKATNLLTLLDAYRDAETVQTYNAAENEHMIAVNEELGFRAVERSTHWQMAL